MIQSRVLLPSILSADFSRLGEEVQAAARGGAGMLHVDVMDGRFVPNITIGPLVVEALRRVTDLPLDTHLMIVEPEKYAGDFVRAGATHVSFHVEASAHVHRGLEQIRGLGAKAGIVLNPVTPLSAVVEALPYCDYVLLMSVNPGFGGQKFIPHVAAKATDLMTLRDDLRLSFAIEMDGGIGEGNIASLAAGGVDWFVAGSAVFGKGQPETATRALLQRMAEGAA